MSAFASDTPTVNAHLGGPLPPWNFNSGSQQVWKGDELLWENYIGKRSQEFNISFDFNSQYRICSNSKLFTATAILQLVEKGKISSIHDDIALYLDSSDLQAWGLKSFCPQVINQTVCEKITFVSLMSMSSGILPANSCPYTPSQWQYKYCMDPNANLYYPGSIARAIQLFIKNPLTWAPGPYYAPEKFNPYQYVNENFIVLSYFVEKLSAMPLAQYFQQFIFDVINMPGTVYDPYNQAFQVIQQPVSEYFYFTDLTISLNAKPFYIGSCTSVEVQPGVQSGSGGISSSLPDMARWYSSLFLKRNTTVLSNYSISQLIYPWSQAEKTPIPQYFGLGLELIFLNPPLFPPQANTAPQPDGIYYMGGSVCTFFSIAIWFSDINPFNPTNPLSTMPLLSIAARNNRILNVSETAYTHVSQSGGVGSFNELTANWGWGVGDLTDTLMVALNTLFYFGET